MKTLMFLASLVLCATVNAQDALTKEESDVMGKLKLLELQAASPRCQMLSTAVEDCKNIESDMAALYLQVSRSPRLVRMMLSDAVMRYQRMKDGTKSAMQVSQIVDQQNAQLVPLLVLQNQRIIELLEIIAKKPR
jgi:hypothetical protein